MYLRRLKGKHYLAFGGILMRSGRRTRAINSPTAMIVPAPSALLPNQSRPYHMLQRFNCRSGCHSLTKLFCGSTGTVPRELCIHPVAILCQCICPFPKVDVVPRITLHIQHDNRHIRSYAAQIPYKPSFFHNPAWSRYPLSTATGLRLRSYLEKC
jgi:hypothetical protein